MTIGPNYATDNISLTDADIDQIVELLREVPAQGEGLQGLDGAPSYRKSPRLTVRPDKGRILVVIG